MAKRNIRISDMFRQHCIKKVTDVLTVGGYVLRAVVNRHYSKQCGHLDTSRIPTPSFTASKYKKGFEAVKKLLSLSLMSVGVILIIILGIIGCSDMPYTGSMLKPGDVDKYLFSPGDGRICITNGFETACLTLVPKRRYSTLPIIHIYPSSIKYIFYYKGVPILQAERPMDTTEIVEQITGTGTGAGTREGNQPRDSGIRVIDMPPPEDPPPHETDGGGSGQQPDGQQPDNTGGSGQQPPSNTGGGTNPNPNFNPLPNQPPTNQQPPGGQTPGDNGGGNNNGGDNNGDGQTPGDNGGRNNNVGNDNGGQTPGDNGSGNNNGGKNNDGQTPGDTGGSGQQSPGNIGGGTNPNPNFNPLPNQPPSNQQPPGGQTPGDNGGKNNDGQTPGDNGGRNNNNGGGNNNGGNNNGGENNNNDDDQKPPSNNNPPVNNNPPIKNNPPVNSNPNPSGHNPPDNVDSHYVYGHENEDPTRNGWIIWVYYPHNYVVGGHPRNSINHPDGCGFTLSITGGTRTNFVQTSGPCTDNDSDNRDDYNGVPCTGGSNGVEGSDYSAQFFVRENNPKDEGLSATEIANKKITITITWTAGMYAPQTQTFNIMREVSMRNYDAEPPPYPGHTKQDGWN